MLVTPFGDVRFGDEYGLKAWFAAHAQRHRVLRKAVSRLGPSLSGMPLDGPESHEWFGRHGLVHQGLLRFMQPDPSVSINVLMDTPWNTEQGFYAWHKIHNLLHSRLDQALGVR